MRIAQLIGIGVFLFGVLGLKTRAQAQSPATWNCPPEWYGDGLCDCGCGAYDQRDCSTGLASACQYSSCWSAEPVESANWRCYGGPATALRYSGWKEFTPATWRGTAAQYSDAVCSCGLGSFDQACTSPFWHACQESACLNSENPNANWSCDGFSGIQSWYNTNDGCDCGYGEFDPDCVDGNANSCQYWPSNCRITSYANWACGPVDLSNQLPASNYCAPYDTYDSFEVPLEEAILKVINQRRAQGYRCASDWYNPPAHPVMMNSTLRCAARPHADDLAAGRVEPHAGFSDRLRAAGYTLPGAAEVVVFHSNLDKKLEGQPYYVGPGHPTWSYAEGIVDSWLLSPAHCAVLTSSEYDIVGIGVSGPFRRSGSNVREAVAVAVFGHATD